MFTYLLYEKFLASPEPYWSQLHIGVIWGLGVYLDALLVFVLYVGALSAGVMSQAQRARALASLARVRHFVTHADRTVIVLAGVFLAMLVLVTFVSVIGRTFWASIPDDITFAEWAMVAMVVLMLGVTQGQGEHIEVTALAERFPVRVNQFLRLIGVLIGAVMLARFGYINLLEVPDSFFEETYGSIYGLPMWPPRLVFFIGVAWWVARITVQLFLLAAIQVASFGKARATEEWHFEPLLASDSGVAIEESARVFEESLGGDIPSVTEEVREGRRGA